MNGMKRHRVRIGIREWNENEKKNVEKNIHWIYPYECMSNVLYAVGYMLHAQVRVCKISAQLLLPSSSSSSSLCGEWGCLCVIFAVLVLFYGRFYSAIVLLFMVMSRLFFFFSFFFFSFITTKNVRIRAIVCAGHIWPNAWWVKWAFLWAVIIACLIWTRKKGRKRKKKKT